MIDDAGCRERRSKVAEKCGVDPSAFDKIQTGRDAEPARELDSQQYGFAKFSAGQPAMHACSGKRSRYRCRTRVQDRFIVGIVELEHVAKVTITERCNMRGDARSTDHACIRSTSPIDENLQPRRHTRRRATGYRGPDVVEQLALDPDARGLRQFGPAQSLRVRDKRLEGVLGRSSAMPYAHPRSPFAKRSRPA